MEIVPIKIDNVKISYICITKHTLILMTININTQFKL